MRLRAVVASMAILAPATAAGYVILDHDPAGGTGPGPGRWLFVGGTIEYRHNPASAPAGIDGPALIDEAFATWTNVPSAAIAFSRGADTTESGFDFGDMQNVITWEDPDDALPTGVLAAASMYVPTGLTHGWQSQNFYEITQADIVFNDGVDWTDSDGATLLGGCISGRFDTEAVALHEIGHFLGLGHEKASYATAIMFPSIDDCDATRTSPKADDVNGVTFLYDSGTPPVYPAFDLDEDAGYAPLEVAFDDQSTGNVTSHAWDFGDGGVSTVANPTHEYTAAGVYDVTLTVNGSAAVEQVDAVAVYERPEVDFTADVREGDAPLVVAFTNLSTNEGDDPRFRWQLDGVTSNQENLTHEFTDPGTYTVIFSVDAGGGYVAQEKQGYIHVRGEPEEEIFPGCSCRVAGGSRRSLLALLLGVLALAFAHLRVRLRNHE